MLLRGSRLLVCRFLLRLGWGIVDCAVSNGSLLKGSICHGWIGSGSCDGTLFAEHIAVIGKGRQGKLLLFDLGQI